MPPRPRPFIEALASSMALDDNGCWIWIKDCTHAGYGLLHAVKDGRRRAAHVWVWQNIRGEIPSGMQLDHLCRIRNCVNPDHLEIVTPAENVRRAHEAKRAPGLCFNGHPFDQYGRIDANGWRTCRECSRLNQVRYRARRAARVGQ